MAIKKEYVWQKQSIASDLEVIDCLVYDPISDFRMDPSGCYVLIRPLIKEQIIEVAICDKKHVIIKVFRGKKSQDVYHGIFTYEKKHKVEWFKSKHHIAYLGKELKKAEWALRGQDEYWQE
ncbi:MAG: DUF4346 domain-containing protein [Candidatus Omnitrophica bacterium]|nr:DUF4346 domain-containing protein [Candidatus Omnitrophota bacterium]